MANVNLEQTKVEIALAVLKMDETGKSKKEIAEEYGVSTRSVNRYADKFEAEAMDIMTAEAPEENKALNDAFEPKQEEKEAKAPKKKKKETKPKEEEVKEEADTPMVTTDLKAKYGLEEKEKDVKPGKRGGKPRNGRWELLNQIFEEQGLESKSADLYRIVNEESEKAGLKPLAKGSFYAMLSIARKSAGISMRKKKEEKPEE